MSMIKKYLEKDIYYQKKDRELMKYQDTENWVEINDDHVEHKTPIAKLNLRTWH